MLNAECIVVLPLVLLDWFTWAIFLSFSIFLWSIHCIALAPFASNKLVSSSIPFIVEYLLWSVWAMSPKVKNARSKTRTQIKFEKRTDKWFRWREKKKTDWTPLYVWWLFHSVVQYDWDHFYAQFVHLSRFTWIRVWVYINCSIVLFVVTQLHRTLDTVDETRFNWDPVSLVFSHSLFSA